MDADQAVVEHYTNPELLDRILAGVVASGLDPDALTPEQLGAVDQLHVGAAPAAVELAHEAAMGTGTRVLDLGSGLGGPARLWANQFSALVHGVDVTVEFVTAATDLTRRCGLEGRASFAVGSAAQSGLDDASMQVVTLMHVGMNIADKEAVFAEAARVLEPGGVFAIYDVMVMAGDGGSTGSAGPTFPLPWADVPNDSYAASPREYRTGLAAAGFEVTSMRDRSAEGIEHFAAVAAASAATERPPLGLHLVMGPTAPTRSKNLVAALREGLLAPTLMLARRSTD